MTGSRLERKDWLSLAGPGIAVLTLVLGVIAFLVQKGQIDALNRTTPTGSIVPFTANGTIPRQTGPMSITVKAENVPVNGRLWIVNHKPFVRAEKVPDRYYPTEVELHGDELVAELVHIGEPADTVDKTYELGLFFCDSVDSSAMQGFLDAANNKRAEGLEALAGTSCKQLDKVRITRLGGG